MCLSRLTREIPAASVKLWDLMVMLVPAPTSHVCCKDDIQILHWRFAWKSVLNPQEPQYNTQWRGQHGSCRI